MTEELRRRLLAAGEMIRAKGWKSASLDLGVSYLAIFDLPPGPHGPMVTFTASIRSNSPHNYVPGWTFGTMEEAVATLEEAAKNMPVFADEEQRKADALAKLSPDERRLIGANNW